MAPRMAHEIPTHLNVQDRLFLGLTARQALFLMVGLSAGYGLWEQCQMLLPPLRLGLAAVCVLTTAVFALWQPGRRPLEEWCFAALHYAATPKASVWRPRDPATHAAGSGRPWQELDGPPRLAWTRHGEHERGSRP